MPNSWRNCVEKLKSEGKSEKSAYSICTSSFINKHGITPKEAEKKGMVDEIFSKLTLQDIDLMDDVLEEELADIVQFTFDEVDDTNLLEWSAPTSRAEIPASHFFWPERKAYPYRNADGSVNCAGVMAAWKMAHGARSGKKAPPNIIAKITPYHDKCMKKNDKEAEDVVAYNRTFDMPNTYFQTIAGNINLDNQKSDPITVPIQVLRKGSFEHPEYGKIEFNELTFDNFIKNFDSGVPQKHVAYDFRHRPDWGAAAWIKKLYKDGDGLWAMVELTKKGLQSLTDKEFLFFSTEYVDNYKDKETGKTYGPTILGGGLTNRPFIKGMAPTVLSEDGEIALFPITNNAEGKRTMDKILAQMEDLKVQFEKLAKGEDKKALEEVSTSMKALEEKIASIKTEDPTKVKELEDKNTDLQKKLDEMDGVVKNLISDRDKSRKNEYKKDLDLLGKELEEKHIWPSVIETVKDILGSFETETKVVKLSEEKEGKKIETELTMKDVLLRVIDAIPDDARVNLSEETDSYTGKKQLTVDEIEVLAKKDGITFQEEVIKLSKEKKLI